MKAKFMKVGGKYLVPIDDDGLDLINQCKKNDGFEVEIKTVHNIAFHKKLFKLLEFGFEMFEPEEKLYNGIPVQKSKEQFRKDMIISAGFYTPVFNYKGECRLEAHSLKFSRCSDKENEEIYRGILTAIWDKILKYKNFNSPDEVDAVVNELLRYE